MHCTGFLAHGTLAKTITLRELNSDVSVAKIYVQGVPKTAPVLVEKVGNPRTLRKVLKGGVLGAPILVRGALQSRRSRELQTHVLVPNGSRVDFEPLPEDQPEGSTIHVPHAGCQFWLVGEVGHVELEEARGRFEATVDVLVRRPGPRRSYESTFRTVLREYSREACERRLRGVKPGMDISAQGRILSRNAQIGDGSVLIPELELDFVIAQRPLAAPVIPAIPKTPEVAPRPIAAGAIDAILGGRAEGPPATPETDPVPVAA